MTWFTHGNETTWIEPRPKRRRPTPRALRFGAIKVGDQLMKAWDGMYEGGQKVVWYYLVSDLWFDPVAGQHVPLAGSMVAIQSIDYRTGEPRDRKEAHTIRGLASQGFHYANIDFIAHTAARNAGMLAGDVVSIAKGKVIRARPKLAGRHL